MLIYVEVSTYLGYSKIDRESEFIMCKDCMSLETKKISNLLLHNLLLCNCYVANVEQLLTRFKRIFYLEDGLELRNKNSLGMQT